MQEPMQDLIAQATCLREQLKKLAAMRQTLRNRKRKKINDPGLTPQDVLRFEKNRLYQRQYYRRVLKAKRRQSRAETVQSQS